jgi:hypothetical protein
LSRVNSCAAAKCGCSRRASWPGRPERGAADARQTFPGSLVAGAFRFGPLPYFSD